VSKQDLRTAAEAALLNTPVWCGKPAGEWTPHRAGINFNFIQSASPRVVIDLLDELARTQAALDEALRGWKSHCINPNTTCSTRIAALQRLVP
jgi:hypothetical protein